MKKKFVYVLVVLLLLVSILGLTACDFFNSNFTGKSDNNSKTEQVESNKTQNVPSQTESNPSGSSSVTENNSSDSSSVNQEVVNLGLWNVQGKEYVFETLNIGFVKFWYPTGSTVEMPEEAYYMPTEEEMQQLTDYIAAQYKGVVVTFEQDNKMLMDFSANEVSLDWDSKDKLQEYNYLQPDKTLVEIGYYGDISENGKTKTGWIVEQEIELTSLNTFRLEVVLFADKDIPITVIAYLNFKRSYV